jgi:hypothetical protein
LAAARALPAALPTTGGREGIGTPVEETAPFTSPVTSGDAIGAAKTEVAQRADTRRVSERANILNGMLKECEVCQETKVRKCQMGEDSEERERLGPHIYVISERGRCESEVEQIHEITGQSF